MNKTIVAIYNNAWKFMKKYADIKQNDADRWEQFRKDVDLIAKNEKYNEYERRFAYRLMQSVVGYIEDISV